MLQFLRMKNLYGQPDPGMVDPAMMDSGGPDPGGIMANMFQPQADDSGNTFVGPTNRPGGVNPAIAADPTSYDAGQRMRDLYKPETMAGDRLNAMVSQYPKKTDFHPSMLRKIGGALTAVGGSFTPHGKFQMNPDAIAFGDSLMDKPYTEKLTDWKNQIGPAQTSANLERQTNVNERSMAYQTVAQELRQHAQDAKSTNDAKKLEISENRAKVYEFKAHHPGAKFDFSGPTVKVMDPSNGTVEDTGIDTGHMSKLDQMNLAHENTMGEIGARGTEARKTEGEKEINRETLEGVKQPNRVELKGTTSGNSPSNKPETPTQTRVRQFNAARELFNTDEKLRPFIKIGSPGANDFTVTPPSDGYFGHSGPTKEQYKKMQDSIYGNTAPAPMSSHTPQGGRTGPTNTPAVPQNGPNLGKEPLKTPTKTGSSGARVKVADMTGKVIGTIPAEQAAQLDKKQYQVVP